MKKYFLIIAVILIILSAYFIFLKEDNSENKVCFEKRCFLVEIVKSHEERQKGLMFRESLDEDNGMLFFFDYTGIYSFWMKNTLIPLDIIWIDENKKIVYIARDVQPCEADPCPSVNPERKALYVLEVNAGESDRAGLETGDIAEFLLE